MRWKKITVDVKTVDGEKTVTGRGIGKFVVHKNIANVGNWTITHSPTGLKLTDMGSKETAVRCVETLSKKIFGFPYMSKERLFENSRRIESVIREFAGEEA